jgi:cysteine desulfuration protein SufE
MTIQELQDEIVEEFEFLEDWDDKYGHIISLGKEMPPFSEAWRTEENKVRGCQSQVWLHAAQNNGKVRFHGDSDALIVKGLVSLLLRVYDNHTPDEILSTPLNFIDRIGLSTHLSPTRSNGLASMVKQIQHYALAFKSIEN